jgi:hypothetical protein
MGSRYFKNFKEPLGFLRELAKNGWFYVDIWFKKNENHDYTYNGKVFNFFDNHGIKGSNTLTLVLTPIPSEWEDFYISK